MVRAPYKEMNMKAVVVHQYGGPEVLKFEEYPDPVPGQGEVLVQVAATSVNPLDYKRRAGLMKDSFLGIGSVMNSAPRRLTAPIPMNSTLFDYPTLNISA
jgi:hypothetical protein